MSYSSRVSLGARGHREPCQVRQAGSSRRWQPLQCPRRPGLAAQGRRRRGQHDRQRSWRCQRSRGWTWLRMLLCRKGEGKRKRRWMDDGMGGTRGEMTKRERKSGTERQRDGAKERERAVAACWLVLREKKQTQTTSSLLFPLLGTDRDLQSPVFTLPLCSKPSPRSISSERPSRLANHRPIPTCVPSYFGSTPT